MKVLLIYELIPENTKIYVIDTDQHTLDQLSKCHGRFGNESDLDPDTDDLLNNWLPVFIEKFTPIYDSENKTTEPYYLAEPHTLIVTGFIL